MVVRVDRHGVFGRRGRNLTLTVPVTYPEAGARVPTLTVPTLDRPGHPARPAGYAVGPDLPGQGPGGAGRRKEPTGDLLVTVDVTVPETLTDEQRAAVEALAKPSSSQPPR